MATQEHTESGKDLDRIDHQDKVAKIRRAVLIGLSAFGELERLLDSARAYTMGGRTLPDGLQPMGVTGDSGEVSNFAEALRFLEEFDEMPLAEH